MKDVLGKLVWIVVAMLAAAEVSFYVSHRYAQTQKAAANEVAVFSGSPPSYVRDPKVDLISLYKKVSRSIVRIDAAKQKNKQLPDKEYLGSGFFADTNGHIVTNYHVIAGSNVVGVIFADGFSIKARVIGTDPSNDVAVLQVSDPRGAKPLALGDSNGLQVGEQVAAIGNPLGLDGSMSEGIVSQLDRAIQAPNGFTISNVIQTDAAINHGSSGGPLFDPWGRVIGITTAIQAEGAGIGFAVPINQVRKSVHAILIGKQTKYAWLGVETIPVSPSVARVLNFHTLYGALITRVVLGSPAAKAGLRACDKTIKIGTHFYKSGCDIIIGIGGKPVHDSNQLAQALAALQPGQKVRFLIKRDGKSVVFNVVIGSRN